MKDLEEMEARIRGVVVNRIMKHDTEEKITPVTYRRFWGHPWYQWRGAVNIPINIVSEDEMREHGLEIGHAKAQARRRFLNSTFGKKNE